MATLLVRRPSPLLADGVLTHLERVPADPVLARRQWEQYVETFRARGWDVVELASADDLPDGVFVEDTVVIFDGLAVLTRPGAESRRGEVATMRPVVENLPGLEVETIEAPGTFDGGDVLKVGRTAYVGCSSRTNEAGIAQLRAVLEPRGWQVVEVPVSKVLHLKSALTALPGGTVIGYEPLIDDVSVFNDFLPVPELHGSAVVVLDDHSVLLSASAPQTAKLLRDRGLEVVTTPISEFEKLEACVVCLSVRVR